MSRREQYEKRAEELLMPVITEKNLELVDIEYVKEGSSWYLRAYIDKEGGVDINDCEAVSRAFSDILDKEDPIEDAYILEVSSPGLGRPLKKDKDFTRNIDKKIEFKSYKAIDGQKEFEGILRSFDAETFTIDDENNNTSTFKRKEMALIREYVEW
ncbi:MAG: ribosome maturation factor RimP [Candidatus Alectryocaccobium sp.]|jgi:ribosome maturation factor RimP|nr:ribosome maturation factor RimP [Lachnospiraceae bacterium]MDY6221445.1 ribosome maturation factor RimP [Candidatus Alectryocaccobium sp.]